MLIITSLREYVLVIVQIFARLIVTKISHQHLFGATIIATKTTNIW